MATPPTYIAGAQTSWVVNTNPHSATAFTVLTGDIVVGAAVRPDNAGTTDFTFGPSTFVEQTLIHGGNGAGTSTGTPTQTATQIQASGGSVTGNISCNSTALPFGAAFAQFRGSNGIGAQAQGTAVAGTPSAVSLNITTTQDNSAILAVFGDWNANDGASRVYRTVNGITPVAGGSGEVAYYRDTTNYAVYVVYWADAGPAGTKTVGISTPATMQWTGSAVEILGVGEPVLGKEPRYIHPGHGPNRRFRFLDRLRSTDLIDDGLPKPVGNPQAAQFASAASCSVTLATGVPDGAFDVIAVNTQAAGVAPAQPSGWNTLLAQTESSGVATTVFYRQRTAGDPTSVTVNLTGGSSLGGWASIAVKNTDPTTPFGTPVGGSDAVSDTTLNVPAFTAVGGYRFDVSGLGSGSTTFTGMPTGLTRLIEATGSGGKNLIFAGAPSTAQTYAADSFTTSAAARGTAILFEALPVSGGGTTNKNDSDTGAGVDAPTAFDRSGIGETGSSTDQPSVFVRSGIDDPGSATDVVLSLTLSLTATETGTGSDAVTAFSIAGVGDSAAGTEAVTATARTGISDSAGTSETATLSVQIAASDVGTAVEAVTVMAKTAADAATADDVVNTLDSGNSKNATETATGTEQIPAFVRTGPDDPAAGVDIVSLFSRVIPEQASAVDSPTALGRSGITEGGAGTETAFLSATVSSADSAVALETQSLLATLTRTEQAVATESASLAVILTDFEVASVLDTVFAISGPPTIRNWSSMEATTVLSGGREVRLTVTRIDGASISPLGREGNTRTNRLEG